MGYGDGGRIGVLFADCIVVRARSVVCSQSILVEPPCWHCALTTQRWLKTIERLATSRHSGKSGSYFVKAPLLGASGSGFGFLFVLGCILLALGGCIGTAETHGAPHSVPQGSKRGGALLVPYG
jgi:hypothetical protein